MVAQSRTRFVEIALTLTQLLFGPVALFLLAMGLGLAGALLFTDSCGNDGGGGLCLVGSMTGLFGGMVLVCAVVVTRSSGAEGIVGSAVLGIVGLLLGLPVYWFAWMWISYWLGQPEPIRVPPW